MTFARRLSIAQAVESVRRHGRSIPIASFLDVQERKPDSLIIDPDMEVKEVYAEDSDPDLLPLIDEIELAQSECPHDQLGHLFVNGKCIYCGDGN